MTLTALFYVVTGVQFWITKYLSDELGNDVQKVGISFVICSATGPTIGVLFGGWLIDKAGGYRGAKQLYKTLTINLTLISIAVLCAFLMSYISNFWFIIFFTWLLLFAGGSIVPSCTAITIDAVPSQMRPLASALAQISYNMFGYALSPILSGAIMEATNSITNGYRSVMMWSVWGLLSSTISYYVSKKQLEQFNQKQLNQITKQAVKDA